MLGRAGNESNHSNHPHSHALDGSLYRRGPPVRGVLPGWEVMSAVIPSGYRKVGAVRGAQWFSLAKTRKGEPITYMMVQSWKAARLYHVKTVKDGPATIYYVKLC